MSSTNPKSPYAPPDSAGESGAGGKKSRKGCLLGCGFLALIGVLWLGFFVYQLGQPGRIAAEAHQKMHPGMTAHEAFRVVFTTYVGVMVHGSICDAGGEYSEGFSYFGTPATYSLTRGDERKNFTSVDDLLRAVSEMNLCDSISFTFLVPGVFPRSSFSAILDADGNVVEITEPYTWD